MSEIKAPMVAKVFDVKVKVGDSVSQGEELLVLEAMKMEMPVIAEISGIVKELKCSKGDTVEPNEILAVLE